MKTNFNIRQIVFTVLSVGLVALAIFGKQLGWFFPWYVQVIFFLVGLAFGIFAVKMSDEAEKERALSFMAGRPAFNEKEFAEQFFSGDRAEIAAKLREILSHHIPVDLSQMQPNDHFVEDLRMDALDSMSTVEYVIEIENEFGIKIPDLAAEKMITFQSVVDYVAEAVKSKAS